MCTHSKWANEQTLKTELRIAMQAVKNDTQVYYLKSRGNRQT